MAYFNTNASSKFDVTGKRHHPFCLNRLDINNNNIQAGLATVPVTKPVGNSSISTLN
jgi:hypothetical protein